MVGQVELEEEAKSDQLFLPWWTQALTPDKMGTIAYKRSAKDFRIRK